MAFVALLPPLPIYTAVVCVFAFANALTMALCITLIMDEGARLFAKKEKKDPLVAHAQLGKLGAHGELGSAGEVGAHGELGSVGEVGSAGEVGAGAKEEEGGQATGTIMGLAQIPASFAQLSVPPLAGYLLGRSLQAAASYLSTLGVLAFSISIAIHMVRQMQQKQKTS